MIGGLPDHRADCARPIAISTTPAPRSCVVSSDSLSQSHPTMAPTTGSSIATIPAVVALTWRSALTSRKNGAIVPSTIIHVARSHTGAWCEASVPPRLVATVSACTGNDEGPEHRREQESPGQERDCVASAHDVLCEQHVERVCERAAERERESGRRERLAAAEDVDDQA